MGNFKIQIEKVIDMKLRNIQTRESISRITFSLRESDAKTLERYVEYVSENVGQEVPTSDVVAAAVKTFMEDEKDFSVWLKRQDKKESKAKEDVKPVTEKPSQTPSPAAALRPAFGG